MTPTIGQLSWADFRDGLLIVNERGQVESIGDATPERLRSVPLVATFEGQVVIPGLIDTHVHFPQHRVVGHTSGSLLQWLERSIFAEEARFSDEAYARAVATEFVEALLARGTTFAAIYSSSNERATEILFEELEARRVSAIVGLTLMDQNAPAQLCVPVAEAIAACERLTKKWHGRSGLSFAVTPRFAISCSQDLLRAAGKFALDAKLLVQTHFAETPDEGIETLKVHPGATDYLDVYEKTGLLGSRTLLAHCIHATDNELSRLRASGAAVAHCPDSNFFLGSGRMPLRALRAQGIALGLGSDVGAGRTCDIRATMSLAHDSTLARGERAEPSDLFELATRGGARALGIDAETGTLEVGKRADFVALSVPSYLRGAETAQVLSHVLFAHDRCPVRATYVGGRRCWNASV